MKSDFVVCIDIGGTHISSAVINKSSESLIADTFVCEYVDSQGSRGDILKQWDRAISNSIKSIVGSISVMLVSIPGPFDYKNGVCLMDGMHKYQALLHMDIKEYLSERFNIPRDNVSFINDAHAFLLGEIYHYRWKGQRIVGLTLGTGLGSAWYDGYALKDLNYGSIRFRDGIAEDYISTRGILTFLSKHSEKRFDNIKDLVESEEAENERVLAFSFLKTALVEFMRRYILSLKPEVIVLGGSIAKAHRFFLEDLEAEISIPIVIASMDEENLFYGMTMTFNINKL